MSSPESGLDIDSSAILPESGLDMDSATVRPPVSGLDASSIKVTMMDGPARPSMYKGFVYSSRESALSGPFNNEFTAIAAKPNSDKIYAVKANREVVESGLLDLNKQEFEPAANPWDFGLSFSPGKTPGIIATPKGEFLYRGRYITEPFAESKVGSFKMYDPMYFKDTQLAISETHWMHFGNESYEKEVYRVDLTFHKNSFGYLWLYLQNDIGKVSGQCKGFITENMKIFANLRGRRFRIKMFIATHENYPWAMREMAIGYNLGKSF